MTTAETVRLEDYTAADFSRLAGWLTTPEMVLQWGGPRMSYPLREDEMQALLAATRTSPPEARIFRAVYVPDDDVVGHIEIGAIDWIHRSGRICRVLVDPVRRGLRLGEHMMRAAVDVGFSELSLHRLELNVYDFNTSAIRCYEKVGFRHEGVRRDIVHGGDAYWSACMMSLLEHEYAGPGRST